MESNWKNARHTLTRIECHSENSKGVYCLQYDDHKIISGLRDNTIKVHIQMMCSVCVCVCAALLTVYIHVVGIVGCDLFLPDFLQVVCGMLGISDTLISCTGSVHGTMIYYIMAFSM